MPIRYTYRRVREFVVHRILHVDDTPHRIALGVAIGMFMAWSPLIGLHMALSLVLAFIFRANKAVAVAMVWVSNPLTMVPMLWAGFKLGERMLGAHYHWRQFHNAVTAAIHSEGSLWQAVTGWWHALWPVLPPLALGSTVIGVVTAAGCYLLTLWGVKAHRRHRLLHGHSTGLDAAAAPQPPAK